MNDTKGLSEDFDYLIASAPLDYGNSISEDAMMAEWERRVEAFRLRLKAIETKALETK